MKSLNRRTWIRQSSLAAAGLGLAPLNVLALNAKKLERTDSEESPVRLCYNENPYGPAPSSRKAMLEKISQSNRYSWDLTNELVAAIAKKHDLKPENIILKAGSTEILDLGIRLASKQNGTFVKAEPTFSTWENTAINLGLKKIAVPLTSDKKNDLKSMANALVPDTRLVYLCNPNNPTSTIVEREEILQFLIKLSPNIILMVDEAYLDFTSEKSLSDQVRNHKNLIIVKTFSKIYGMASARVGYALAHEETIKQMEDMQTWANSGISVVSAAGALAAINDPDFVSDCYKLNEKARTYTIESLEKLGMRCISSHSNFVYFSLQTYKRYYFALLKSHNILGTGVFEENGKWTRISMGTMADMEKFITALQG